MSKVVKSTETKSRMVVAGGAKWRVKWGLVFNRYRVSGLQDEIVVEICCITL